MYLKYKSLNDLLNRRDMSVNQKRKALKVLPFYAFSYDYLQKMNMMKVASGSQETVKGVQVDFYTFLHLVHRFRVQRRVWAKESARKENEHFAKMMDLRLKDAAARDEAHAMKRVPYGMLAAIFKKDQGLATDAAVTNDPKPVGTSDGLEKPTGTAEAPLKTASGTDQKAKRPLFGGFFSRFAKERTSKKELADKPVVETVFVAPPKPVKAKKVPKVPKEAEARKRKQDNSRQGKKKAKNKKDNNVPKQKNKKQKNK